MRKGPNAGKRGFGHARKPDCGKPAQRTFFEGGYVTGKKPLGVLIAVGNQKGGVGKTTNTVHIAAALGQRGHKSLVIDLDPAAGATKHLGVPENSFAGSLELLSTDETVESLAITDKMPKGVHLISSRPQLSELDTVLSKYVDRTRILDRPIALARENYDFIFLDTAPAAAATTTVAAYSTAEWFLLSAFPHPLSLGGLTEAFNDIADVRKHRNPGLEVLGVVFTNVDGRATRLRAQLETVVHEALPARRFETYISQAVILPDLSGRGKTLFQLPRYNKFAVARQYIQLAQEVEHRVMNRDAFLAGTLAPPVLEDVGGPEEQVEEALVANA
jgi:chromosome partitioning protein